MGIDSVTVRCVEDTRARRVWFEEKLDNDQWVKIPSTDMACEGNSRSALAQELNRRYQERLKVFLKIGQEETFDMI